MQERLEELLDKNREEGLTAAEEEEMDAYRLVNHVMILLKARARLTVSSSQSSRKQDLDAPPCGRGGKILPPEAGQC